MAARVICCLLILSCVALGQGAGDKNAINDLLHGSEEAWNHHDAHAFASAFAPDADFTNVIGQGASGRDKIEQFHAPMFATVFKSSQLKLVETKVRFIRPDVAAVDVFWTMSGMVDQQGNPRADRRGLLNFVMTKDAGKWQIAVMHNMDLPPQP